MFAGEAAGLTAMRLASESGGEPSLRIPEVFHAADFEDGKGSFIVMEFLNECLSNRKTAFTVKEGCHEMQRKDPFVSYFWHS